MCARAATAHGLARLTAAAIAAIALSCLPAMSPALARAAPTAAGALGPASFPGPTSPGASSPSAWSRLWWNRDQQGERLLESGNAAGAAQRFRDPQRRAYADLQAGRYTEAARLLTPFKDAESQYNRGNALARAGQLQAALAAYDAALARSPGDRDARHNRELVARALAQQPRPPQQGSRQGSSHGSQQGSQQALQQGSQQGSAAEKPGGSPSGGGAGHDRTAQSGTNQARNQAGNNQTRAANPSGTGAGQSAGGNASATPRSGSASPSGPASPSGSPSPSGALARDATPGSASQTGAEAGAQAGAQAGARKDSRKGGPQGLLAQAQRGSGPATPPNRPPSEQALSLDQWLRRLPDDPGGLLRRKFLIEHLMRQQDQQQYQPQGSP